MGAVDPEFLAWLSWRVERLPDTDPDRLGSGPAAVQELCATAAE